MIKNEKANAGNIGLNEHSEKQLTMNNNIPTKNKFQSDSAQSRRSLLDSTKLSRLPQRKPVKPFTLPDLSFPDSEASGCLACSGRLDADDTIQKSVKVCRRCLTQYAVIDGAIDAASKRKRQAMLERFALEVDK